MTDSSDSPSLAPPLSPSVGTVRHQSPRRLYQPDDSVRAYRMPVRFGMGALLIINGFYGSLFAGMTWLGLPSDVQILVALFPAVVAAAQVIFFRGRRPRLASVLSGVGYVAVVACVFLAIAIIEPLRRRKMSPGEAMEFFFAAMITSVFGPPLGALLGYVVGGLVGGLFLCIDLFDLWWERRRTRAPFAAQAGGADRAPVHSAPAGGPFEPASKGLPPTP